MGGGQVLAGADLGADGGAVAAGPRLLCVHRVVSSCAVALAQECPARLHTLQTR